MRFKNASGHHVMLVVNPSAGKGQLGKKWESEIHPFLSDKLKNFDFEFTKKPGDATRITAQALRHGYTMIVSMGGDGTLNECLNGFFSGGTNEYPDCVLGLLPFGSGGDFARSINLPRNYREAVKHLITKKTKRIDIGRASFPESRIASRYFINIANTGLVALIMKEVNGMNRSVPPLARYLSGTMMGFVQSKNIKVRMRITPQGTHTVNLTNVIVANGQYFGKGMRQTPQAKLDDGLFDVLVIKNATLAQLIMHFPQLYGVKTSLPNKIIENYRATEVAISLVDATDKLYSEMDGENYGEGGVVFQIVPQAIKIKI